MTKAKTRFNRTAQDRPGDRFHVYMDGELHKLIKEAATASFRSVSAWIVEACQEKLLREQKEK